MTKAEYEKRVAFLERVSGWTLLTLCEDGSIMAYDRRYIMEAGRQRVIEQWDEWKAGRVEVNHG